MRINTLEKFYCRSCKSSEWMREVPDEANKDQTGHKCIICGTVHKHPGLWKKPPKTF
jgi:uncharacterized Zn finger protein